MGASTAAAMVKRLLGLLGSFKIDDVKVEDAAWAIATKNFGLNIRVLTKYDVAPS